MRCTRRFIVSQNDDIQYYNILLYYSNLQYYVKMANINSGDYELLCDLSQQLNSTVQKKKYIMEKMTFQYNIEENRPAFVFILYL